MNMRKIGNMVKHNYATSFNALFSYHATLFCPFRNGFETNFGRKT